MIEAEAYLAKRLIETQGILFDIRRELQNIIRGIYDQELIPFVLDELLLQIDLSEELVDYN